MGKVCVSVKASEEDEGMKRPEQMFCSHMVIKDKETYIRCCECGEMIYDLKDCVQDADNRKFYTKIKIRTHFGEITLQ